MIAIFRVLLPFDVYIPSDANMAPINLERTTDGLKITILAPYASKLRRSDVKPSLDKSPFDLFAGLYKDEAPSVVEQIKLDSKACIAANCIQIDFQKADFNRQLPMNQLEEPQTDPPIKYIFDLANGVIEAFRAIGKANFLKPINHDNTHWVLMYRNDDLSELPRVEGLARGCHGAAVTWQVFALGPQVWTMVSKQLMTVNLPTWERLYFDALSLLPEIGPALILGFSAVETLASIALNELARGKLPEELWTWVTERKPHFYRPNTEQMLDVMMRSFTGASPKDDRTLWRGFTDLNKARNNYVHRGVLEINGKEIDLLKAHQLLGTVGNILNWIEERLPPGMIRFPPPTGTKLEISGRIN